MKILLCLLIGMCLALVGCKSDPVVGTWKLDTSSVPNFDKMPQSMKDQFNKGRVTFNADKTMSSDDGSGKTEKGTWELKDKTVTISGSKMNTATLTDDGKLQISVMGTTIKFVRA